MTILQEALVYLVAALLAVPISKRFGFGSVLGYLAAGIIIGPATLALVKEPDHTLHFAELGVVFLLFIIGLELQPSRLWVLRKMVFGLGALQVFVTALAIAGVAYLFGQDIRAGIVVGLILALSSTAFVLQMLAEKKQLQTSYGRAAFAILLFQDLAVIPLIALLPMLAQTESAEFSLQSVGIATATIVGLIVGGRYLLRPALRIAARTDIPEIFTATALLVVIGAALLMEFAGMSMVLGAFIAGMLLADSEYRHELEASIAPFKGLLLGLFFIAVGMSVNLQLLVREPVVILSIAAMLMIVKAGVLYPLARIFGICDRKGAVRLAVVLSQGGEFAFVLFGIVGSGGIIDQALMDRLILAVTVSMLFTPIAYLLVEKYTDRLTVSAEPEYDDIDEAHNPVIIAGFGRFGQIVGRILTSTGRSFTALDIDASQVEVVRRYGNKVYFGDISRLDLLRAAGAAQAKLFVLAIGDMETSLRTAETVRHNFPDLKILARARNRRHEYHLMDLGVEHIYRETLHSSLTMGQQVLIDLGLSDDETERVLQTFTEHDQRLIREQQAVHHDEEMLIQTTRETVRELELLLRDDQRHG